MKPGYLVALKSSEMKMVVQKVYEESDKDVDVGDVLCVWHDKEGHLHRETFDPVTLWILP